MIFPWDRSRLNSISLVLQTLLILLYTYTWFLVPLVACLGGVPTPIIRAKMSKLVDADEQGE